MNVSSFADYALSTELTEDEIYTLELLIEKVSSSFDPEHWQQRNQRTNAREAPGYIPFFSPHDFHQAAEELVKLTWLSFQRMRSTERPVRDLGALRYLPDLTGLSLTGNVVEDLTPLENAGKLRQLFLTQNLIHDLRPLVACQNLEELDLCGIPAENFSVLQSLPRLRYLLISSGQVPLLKQLTTLPVLQKLEITSGEFDSFEGFPSMPELRVIWGAKVGSLRGLDSFPGLFHLANISGSFQSLEPLRCCKNLTHVNLSDSQIESVGPLREVFTLRDLWVRTSCENLDLSPLESLPALHQVTVKCGDKEAPGLDKLRSQMTSWDLQFKADKPRSTPLLEIEVVDQETFDHFDFKEHFNLTEKDINPALLSSELEWLDERLEEVFITDFCEGEDYFFPHQWRGARSRTIVILSDLAVEAFPKLVLNIQTVLSEAKNDWIIYFQTDGPEIEFIIWIYADKIMVTAEHANSVKNLISPH